jgi:hypothetical protein
MMIVPQTDTGGWGENPKAYGTMFVQELGKKAAVPSVYGLTFYVLGSV